MNIAFRRNLDQEFEVTSGRIVLKGRVSAYKQGFILMKAQLNGSFEVPCDLCAEPFDIILDEKVELLLHEGTYSGADDKYDIVEIDSSIIDMDEILHSEIELIKNDYHRCDNCKK
jgi:uncharacterized metal-binding protein YceD (DUF177 family)